MNGVDAHHELDSYARNMLREKLLRCTVEQQDLFGRMYREGVDKIPYSKLEWAIHAPR